MNKLQEISQRFTSRLHFWIQQIQHKGAEPKQRDWIEKLLVFFAIEDCQVLFENEENLRCRFSMGLSKKEYKAELQKKLKDARRTLFAEDYAKKAVDRLREFLVDFSMSRYSIPQTLGSEEPPIPAEHRFEFLIIAESEMGDTNDILYDLLKLACVYGQNKIMVFKAIELGPEREAFFDRVLNVIHNSRREDDNALWLFVGIPEYKQWLDNLDNPAILTRSIHVFDPTTNSLIEKDDWWSWEKEDLETTA